jgi:hypothetical protein
MRMNRRAQIRYEMIFLFIGITLIFALCGYFVYIAFTQPDPAKEEAERWNEIEQQISLAPNTNYVLYKYQCENISRDKLAPMTDEQTTIKMERLSYSFSMAAGEELEQGYIKDFVINEQSLNFTNIQDFIDSLKYEEGYASYYGGRSSEDSAKMFKEEYNSSSYIYDSVDSYTIEGTDIRKSEDGLGLVKNLRNTPNKINVVFEVATKNITMIQKVNVEDCSETETTKINLNGTNIPKKSVSWENLSNNCEPIKIECDAWGMVVGFYGPNNRAIVSCQEYFEEYYSCGDYQVFIKK